MLLLLPLVGQITAKLNTGIHDLHVIPSKLKKPTLKRNLVSHVTLALEMMEEMKEKLEQVTKEKDEIIQQKDLPGLGSILHVV